MKSILFKFKKASLANILAFILMFTLFFTCSIAIILNNKTLEERSSIFSAVNTEMAYLQATLNGYSTNPHFLNMYSGGVKLSQSQAEAIKNKAINDFKHNVRVMFEGGHNTRGDKVNSNGTVTNGRKTKSLTYIDTTVEIEDSSDTLGNATIVVRVRYKGSFRSPFVTDNASGTGTSSTTKTNTRLGITYTDYHTRQIENPVRNQNTGT